MPTFDYHCKDCNSNYEIFHKGKENLQEVICPRCGSRNSVKLFSAPMLNIGKIETSGNCDSCSDNAPSYGGCASGLCGID
ncbi:MAG: hypothetical protein IGBAC_1920 [Ignavibacteriae bacterium]|nr:MAG: hypothetical protein IGBAC_1920 [Ignavibacteriota bacterium]